MNNNQQDVESQVKQHRRAPLDDDDRAAGDPFEKDSPA
jgi:hypothetical protein